MAMKFDNSRDRHGRIDWSGPIAAFIRDRLAEGMSAGKAAKAWTATGRGSIGKNSIIGAAHRNGWQLHGRPAASNGKEWMPAEIEILRNGRALPTRELAKLLPNRTYHAVTEKRSSFGLTYVNGHVDAAPKPKPKPKAPRDIREVQAMEWIAAVVPPPPDPEPDDTNWTPRAPLWMPMEQYIAHSPSACQWLDGDQADATFCDHQARLGSSYCDRHHARAYIAYRAR